jgi:hypothetical protein
MPAAAQAAPAAQQVGTIPVRTLGKTGLKLPILGYGGAALPKAWRIPLRPHLPIWTEDRDFENLPTVSDYRLAEVLPLVAPRRCPSPRCTSGISTLTYVPLPGPLSIVAVPPISLSGRRVLPSPKCPGAFLSDLKPTPQSRT